MSKAGHFRGFTLIELLIVMLIIGVLSTTAILSYSPPPFKETREKLNVLLDQINTAQEKALLESLPLGLLFFQQKYIFLTIENRTWRKYMVFPEVEIDLQDASLVVDNISINLPDADLITEIFPQIVFSPGAEMTPFELILNLHDENSGSSTIFELKTDILGRGKLLQYQAQ
jgi:general secretion pathway protein H